MQSRTFLPLLGSMLVASATVMQAQQKVPVHDLAAVDAKTATPFGNILGVRQLTGGKVLVNDGTRRQLVMLDGKLSNPSVVVDSVSEGGNSYGPRAAPLIPYLADSSLFVDGTSLSLLVIDPNGKVAHVMSAPKPGDLRFLASGASGVDAKGNLIYRAVPLPTRINAPTTPGGMPTMPTPPDSAAIVRANFDTRAVDTIGRIKMVAGNRTTMMQGEDGKMMAKTIVNPVPTVDEWAVLSDGTIAMVRGQDYHVDFIRPDGSKASSPKLPFDWKRLTDEDKQQLVDSARTAMEKADADRKANAGKPGAAGPGSAAGNAVVEMSMVRVAGGGGGGGMQIGGRGDGGGMPTSFTMPTPTLEFVPFKEMADYYPAIRAGAAKADLDGNLWILPTTSAQSKAGELVYDVVNNRGDLTHRVRMPVGRSIAGFGHDGVVYLMYRDVATGWFLERASIAKTASATN
jgi:hypothetical protein